MSAAAPAGPAASADAPGSLREALPILLRHASPRLVGIALAVALAARVALGGFTLRDLLPVAGLLLLWPLQEWLIHVFILHFRPREIFGRTLDFRVPRSHRLHHRDPWNYEILFIPFHSFLYSLPVLVLAWLALTRDVRLALTGICAHLLLTLHYEAVHFLVHTRVAPRTRFYRRLWRNHRLHHFKSEHYWYGVSMLSADRLLGTRPAPRDVASSPTARALHGLAPEVGSAPGP